MKKTILGSAMLVSGMLGTVALLYAGMMKNLVNDEAYSALWNIGQYGLTPMLWLFAVLAVAGLGLAIWGIFSKD